VHVTQSGRGGGLPAMSTTLGMPSICVGPLPYVASRPEAAPLVSRAASMAFRGPQAVRCAACGRYHTRQLLQSISRRDCEISDAELDSEIIGCVIQV
jgi:hypothetical protein